MADYILTYSKKKFYPVEPKIEDIDIIDIAHALSLMTRANGHFKQFYSVAQHSINCCMEAKARGYSEKIQLACLLHDASESYISDITRPIKKYLTEYCTIEEKLQEMIYNSFGLSQLSEVEKNYIEEVDDAILYFEFLEFMDYELFEIAPEIKSKPDFNEKSFVIVENEFIRIFNMLTGDNSSYICVGIDVCEGKWVAVCISDRGFEVDKFNTIEEIYNKYQTCDRYIIDIPIGLPESMNDYRPDSIVRKLLGKKGSSIFSVPCRQAVYSNDKELARINNISVMGKSLSEQSIGISKAIRQVDEFLEKHPEWKNKLLESHPEFCFLKLNDGNPILEDKKTKEGQRARLDVLMKYYSNSSQVIEKFLSDVPYRKKLDDVIDALCLAVMGKEILLRGLKTIPENPEKDSKGIIMQMVYTDC